MADLDVLIDGLRRRFACRKVVLVAHSWGTVPGLLYAERRPENLAAYVGIGQEADALESERRSYEFVLESSARTARWSSTPSASSELGRPHGRAARYGRRELCWKNTGAPSMPVEVNYP